ncbi:hypothetical protein [Deinococcus multiflagellatus]|uniref:Uncharacterized protein n=1 Tax=Deinococcus multiflagellatus TaxID=1656887 RepID=A0ABW1ZRP8_9DEIO|nr:hypothetical protein [Deinococcus multiflagellatus]MBZ9715386.1 hypothetical protein [Deinococcus multiflagellatus]
MPGNAMSGELEVIEVLEISGGLASVRLPDTSIEVWPLGLLPVGVEVGDHVGVSVDDGTWTTVLLPRPAGLLA